MKTLIVVRHAKSSWDTSVPDDFNRPLNDRGKKDAPASAKRLVKKGVAIDTFLSSPAKRAKKTAQCFIKEYNKSKDKIIYLPQLYEATLSVFYEVVMSLDDSYNDVALFSHNPGVTEFVNTLTEVHIDNMPTCAVFAVKINTNKWADFRLAQKEFWFFDYPKLHQ